MPPEWQASEVSISTSFTTSFQVHSKPRLCCNHQEPFPIKRANKSPGSTMEECSIFHRKWYHLSFPKFYSHLNYCSSVTITPTSLSKSSSGREILTGLPCTYTGWVLSFPMLRIRPVSQLTSCFLQNVVLSAVASHMQAHHHTPCHDDNGLNL